MREAFDAEDLGRAIRAVRRARGWTQSQLAAWLGVTRQTVASLEHGGPVSLRVAMRAIALLGAKITVVPKATVLAVGERPRG